MNAQTKPDGMQSGEPLLQDWSRAVLGFVDLSDPRHEHPVRIVRGERVRLYDEQGHDYIDGMSNFYACSLGYGDPELTQAAVEQIRSLPICTPAFFRTASVLVELANELASMVPITNARIAFGTTGSEANDFMLKFIHFRNMTMGQTQRRKIMGRTDSYHGSTIATASIGGWASARQYFGLDESNRIFLRQPDLIDFGVVGETEEEFTDRMIGELDETIRLNGPESIAALFVDPVSFSAGLVIPPKDYLRRAAELVRNYGILLIDDEVVTAFGRIGARFATENFHFTPDCMTFSKALSSAYLPISAIAMSDEFYFQVQQGSRQKGAFPHGGTYHGHAVCAAVALSALRIYRKRRIEERVREVAPLFHSMLNRYIDYPEVLAVRKIGLAGALQFRKIVNRNGSSLPGSSLADMFAQLAFDRHRLIVRPIRDRVMVVPPLIINEQELAELFDRFDATLNDTLAWARGA